MVRANGDTARGRAIRFAVHKMARPAGIDPPAPRLRVLTEDPTWGSETPLPLILLAFCQNPRPPETTSSRYGLSAICQPLIVAERSSTKLNSTSCHYVPRRERS